MESIKRIYRNSVFSFKGLYGFWEPQTYILVKVVEPILQVLYFSLIAKHAYGNANIAPYVIGNAFVLCTISAFFGVGTNLIEERSLGTLKLLIASPCNKFAIFTSKAVFYILDGAVTVFIGLLTGCVFFNIRIPLNLLPQFSMCLAAAMFSTCAMGLFIGSIGLVTRDINLLLNLASMGILSLSGVNFSTAKLPFILQKLSDVIPLTNALKGCRIILNYNNSTDNRVYMYIMFEFLLGIAYCIIAYVAFKVMEKRCKIKASTETY